MKIAKSKLAGYIPFIEPVVTEESSDVSTIPLNDVDVMYTVEKDYPSNEMGFLYRRIGKNKALYKVRMLSRKYSHREIESLISKAYKPAYDPEMMAKKEDACLALETSVYLGLYLDPEHPKFKQYRDVLYSAEMINEIVYFRPEIVGLVPDNIPRYNEVMATAIYKNPDAFEFLSMTKKLEPELIDALFYSRKEYDSIYQHRAIRYAKGAQITEFIKVNGLLMEELSGSLQDDNQLAYVAMMQNVRAKRYVSERIQKLVSKKGMDNLNTPIGKAQLFWIIKKPILLEKIGAIKHEFIRTLMPFAPYKHYVVQAVQSVYKKSVDWPSERPKIDKDALPNDSVAVVDDVEIKERMIEFEQDFKIYADKDMVKRIEDEAGDTQIQYLWRLADLGGIGSIFVVYFKPLGDEYQGAIVLAGDDTLSMTKYPAIYSLDGTSIWRVDDAGEFSPNVFEVERVFRAKEGSLRFVLKWRGAGGTNYYRLSQKGKDLFKEYIVN
ncbi:MAG: hypothetical protein O3A01_08835, partial [bacterium]|nr:hypothetical protein [bacterium]